MSEVGAPRSPSRLRSPGGSRRAIDGYFSYSLPEHFLIDSVFAEQLKAATILGGGGERVINRFRGLHTDIRPVHI